MDSNNPYTGKRITLISKSGIRYEGILINVNPDNATVELSQVRIFGSEERSVAKFVPPSDGVFDSVLFRGTDIREIALINDEPEPFIDPAILKIQQPSAPIPQATASQAKPSSDRCEARDRVPNGRDNWQTSGAQRLPFARSNGAGTGTGTVSTQRDSTSDAQTQNGPYSRQQRTDFASSPQGHDQNQRSGPINNSFFDREPPTNRMPSGGAHMNAYHPRGGAPAWAAPSHNAWSNSHNPRGSFGFGFDAPFAPYGHHEPSYGYGPAYGPPHGFAYGNVRDYDQRGGNNAPWTRGGNGNGNRGWHASGPANRGGWRRGGGPGAAWNSTGASKPATTEYQEEFDFESGNSQLAHELEKLNLDGLSPKGDGAKAEGQKEADESTKCDEQDEKNPNASEDEDSTQDEAHYNKQKSFFDSISSDMKNMKKPNWSKERQVNVETFGQSAFRRGSYSNTRGSSRGWRRGAYAY